MKHSEERRFVFRAFDNQAEGLGRRGIRPMELKSLRQKVLDMGRADGSINSYLIVVPFSLIPFKRQISAIDLGGGKGYAYLDPSLIRDVGKTKFPDTLYLLTSIEDGAVTCGTSPEEATRSLRKVKRRPMTVNHALAMLLQWPEVLWRHNVHLSGSRIQDERTGRLLVPDFYRYAARLKMKQDPANATDENWGTPSYGRVVVP